MLHTRVRCRARAWDVIDMHRDAGVTWWRLRHDHDPSRLLASPPDDVQPLEVSSRRVSPRAWARAMLGYARACMPSWWPSALLRLPVERLAWQHVPAMLILSGRHRRLLLADPVGMGKTVQAALLLREVHDRDPEASSLVVSPASLVAQWSRELRDRAGLEASVLDATRLRAEAQMPTRIVDEARRGACWLVSVDMVRQADVAPLFSRVPWTMLVVDEAHAAAPGTARLDAVRAIARSSARVLLLTATPTACGPQGLEALRAIGAGRGDAPMPVMRRAPARGGPARRTCALHVRLDRAHAIVCTRLDAFADRARADRGSDGLLPALVLRRRAASCPGALARSIERRLLVLGSGGEATFDQPLLFADQDAQDEECLQWPAWRDSSAERRELEDLLGCVRILPPHGRKLDVVARLLRRCREPAVVFSTHVDTARLLRSRLEGHRLAFVHGGLPDALRTQAVEAFTAGAVDVLVTTDASAEGLNLHARCRLVIHADLPVSPRLLAQRTGRVDRLGQRRRVHEVILSSQSSWDVEQLARLRAGTAQDAGWLEGQARRETRRTRLAEACLARAHVLQAPAGYRDVRTTSTLAPARWHRLRTRWGLPSGALALRVSTVTVSGTTPLATSAVSMAVVTTAAAALPAGSTAAVVAGRVRRAEGRTRRIDGWQHAAQARAALGRGAPSRDLFTSEENGPGDSWSFEPGRITTVHGAIGVRGSQGAIP